MQNLIKNLVGCCLLLHFQYVSLFWNIRKQSWICLWAIIYFCLLSTNNFSYHCSNQKLQCHLILLVHINQSYKCFKFSDQPSLRHHVHAKTDRSTSRRVHRPKDFRTAKPQLQVATSLIPEWMLTYLVRKSITTGHSYKWSMITIYVS